MTSKPIKISIEIKADPALIDAVNGVLAALGVSIPSVVRTAETVDAEPAEVAAPAAQPKKPAKSTAHIAQPPAATPAPTPAPTTGQGATVIEFPTAAPAPSAPAAQAPAAKPAGAVTVEDVRAAGRLLADKKGRDQVAALAETFGVKSLAAVPEDKRAAFVEAALAQAQA